MKKAILVFVAMVAVGVFSPSGQAEAVVVNLAENYFWDSGGAIDISGFNVATGLGTVSFTVTSAGSHYVGLFLDHELDEPLNTFFNEYGAASGVLAAGQSWEIDEPGWVYGDIVDNFASKSLDNTNGVPSSAPDDVSMALAWDFSLAAGETGLVSFLVGLTAPSSGFYLSHTDPDSGASIYFSSSLTVGGGEVPVPEPSTLLVVGSALGWFALLRKRMKG